MRKILISKESLSKRYQNSYNFSFFNRQTCQKENCTRNYVSPFEVLIQIHISFIIHCQKGKIRVNGLSTRSSSLPPLFLISIIETETKRIVETGFHFPFTQNGEFKPISFAQSPPPSMKILLPLRTSTSVPLNIFRKKKKKNRRVVSKNGNDYAHVYILRVISRRFSENCGRGQKEHSSCCKDRSR